MKEKYFWACMSVGEGIYQPLIVRGEKPSPNRIGLILPDGLTSQIPVNAEVKIIAEVPAEEVTRIKTELVEAKYRANHGIRNF